MQLNIIKYISITIFLIGTLIATICASKVPTEGQTYPDTLPLFIVGAVLAVIGVIAWHMINKKLVKEKIKNKDTSDDADPLKIMESMQPELKTLDDTFESLTTETIMVEVDKILDNYILPIANIREDVTNILGMSKGSEVLLTFAYGERILNRVWSAASDNHITEARNVYPEASNALKLAWTQAETALKEISV